MMVMMMTTMMYTICIHMDISLGCSLFSLRLFSAWPAQAPRFWFICLGGLGLKCHRGFILPIPYPSHPIPYHTIQQQKKIKILCVFAVHFTTFYVVIFLASAEVCPTDIPSWEGIFGAPSNDRKRAPSRKTLQLLGMFNCR